jgi:hypothetical protein
MGISGVAGEKDQVERSRSELFFQINRSSSFANIISFVEEWNSSLGEEEKRIRLGFEPENTSIRLLIDITAFISVIKAYYNAVNIKNRKLEVQKILSLPHWHEHYKDKQTGRRVLSELNRIEHEHERRTAICLAQMNYDIVFAPGGMFQRGAKKFDIYLLRDSIILEADLKCISSQSPLTIAYRIREGSEQASRVVLHITSDLDSKILIQALRNASYRNRLLKEVLLIYKRKFYRLPKTLIMSNRIFDIIKSEKGYT